MLNDDLVSLTGEISEWETVQSHVEEDAVMERNDDILRAAHHLTASSYSGDPKMKRFCDPQEQRPRKVLSHCQNTKNWYSCGPGKLGYISQRPKGLAT